MTAVENLMLAASGSLVLSVLLKVTATPVFALALVRLARRRRAAFRHVLLAAAFAVLIVLPVAAAVAPAIRVAVPVAAHQAAATADVELSLTPHGRAHGRPASGVVRPAPVSSSTILLAVWISARRCSCSQSSSGCGRCARFVDRRCRGGTVSRSLNRWRGTPECAGGWTCCCTSPCLGR
jgi:hypothetical protein